MSRHQDPPAPTDDSNVDHASAATPAAPASASGPAPLLKASDIGFFNPKAPPTDKQCWKRCCSSNSSPSCDGAPSHVQTFVDVSQFVERLLHVAGIEGERQVVRIWMACLQGAALEWYNHKLRFFDREMMKEKWCLKEICGLLFDHWKPEHARQQRSAFRDRVGMWDVNRGQCPVTHVAGVIEDAKKDGRSDAQQLSIAHESLDLGILVELDRPNSDTTPQSFLSNLRDRGPALKAKAKALFKHCKIYDPEPGEVFEMDEESQVKRFAGWRRRRTSTGTPYKWSRLSLVMGRLRAKDLADGIAKSESRSTSTSSSKSTKSSGHWKMSYLGISP